jgi:O-acetyl-ADP-ribose deacetylase (regulator of RNase III)
MKLSYVIGDATNPQREDNKLIIHIVNDIGAWGAGFVLALSKRWKEPEETYRAEKKYVLSNVQFVKVAPDIYVANMIAQHGIKATYTPLIPFTDRVTPMPPIRYDALLICLRKVNIEALKLNATIHAPRFGAGLAGGKWSIIEKLILKAITVDVTIYDLK